MSFLSRDYALMNYYYGYARGNASAAARLYREHVMRNSDHRPSTFPDHHVILRAHNAYMEGRMPGVRTGRPALVSDPNMIDAVLEEVTANPAISVRRIEHRTGIRKSTAHRILQQEGYHPYHIQRVQQLKPEDWPRRIAFCQEMLRRQSEDENFFKTILWTDESHFKRCGVFNIHNYHSWNIQNPHESRGSNFQEHFSVNLWSGIVNGQLIGPFELPDRLNGDSYLNFLREDLNGLLDNVDLATRRNLIIQIDGAPCHYASIVRQYLNERFRDKWIGRGGPIAWPARSPDLNPIDFFLWGYYKELVYDKEQRNITELRVKLRQAAEIIKNNRMAFVRLQGNFFRRCRICIEHEGRNFENFL